MAPTNLAKRSTPLRHFVAHFPEVESGAAVQVNEIIDPLRGKAWPRPCLSMVRGEKS
jgi:hypothetical protein